MKKTYIIFGMLAALILISFLMLGIFFLIKQPGGSDNPTAYDNNYRYLDYTVDVVVNEDNSYDITESIQTEFQLLNVLNTNESHGIYRYIPLNNTIYRHDGEKEIIEDYYTRITNVDVSYRVNGGIKQTSYFSSTEDGFLVLVIGDEDELVNGKIVDYSINYKFNAGYDRDKTMDFLYLNLLGEGRTTYIDNFSFSITMPKSFDRTATQFYVGEFGETSGAEKLLIVFDEANNIITGQYIGVDAILKDEAITIYIKLPENYFTVNLLMPIGDIVIIALSLFILAIMVVITLKHFSKKQIVNKPVEFFPPNDYNPPEAGFILNGYTNNKKISSLIIYWASKGYLKIDATNINDIKLTRLVSELPENTRKYEKTLFENLFKKPSQLNIKKDIKNIFIGLQDIEAKTKNNMKDTTPGDNKTENYEEEFPTIKINNVSSQFAMSVMSAKNTVKVSNGGAPVSSSSKVASVAIKILGVIPFILFSALYFYRINMQPIILIFALALAVMQVAASIVLSYGYYLNANESGNTVLKSRLYKISIVLLSVAYLFIYMLWFNYAILDPYGLKYIVVAVALFANFCSVVFISLRENIKNDFGKLEGFRNFIEMAEKDRIKVLVNDNPSYFYDILPYAYVFNVTNEFSKKFEGFTIAPSAYIMTTNVYDILFINMMFSNINLAISKSIAINMSKTSSSRSGGFGGGFGGGGGFSGGGFGGGGSGRW